jgi:hypothetical protein
LASSPVGEYNISFGELTATNYDISYISGTLIISQAPLTITVVDITRPYGTDNPDFSVQYTGFVNGDTNIQSPPSFTTAAVASSPLGQYTVTASGAVASNYLISYLPGTLTVGKATLTITAEDKIRQYGQADPAFSFVISGFVQGDNETSLQVQPTMTTAAGVNSPVGEYPIVIGQATSANYDIVYENGTLHITSPVLAPLPSSGSISMFDVADYMMMLGEITPAERAGGFSIGFLNAKSHLVNKIPPFQLRDWLGYGQVNTSPTLVTSAARNITTSSFQSGGFINNDGGAMVVEHGLCWSTSPLPTIANNKQAHGPGTGDFSITINGLLPGTTYYVRAYAKNDVGTAYGNQVIVKTKTD